MTPRRRQGSGRAAVDHIAAGLTDALSTLSKVSVSQAVIADVARGDLDRAKATLERLDRALLKELIDAAGQMHSLIRHEFDRRLRTPPAGSDNSDDPDEESP